MDVLRSCYTRECRFFTDSDDTVTVKWYFCADESKVLPYSTPFASANWYDDECLNQPLGELPLTTPRWSNGATPPTANPNHICGTEDEWRNGFPSDTFLPGVEYDEHGIPFCCYPDERDVDVGDGGVELDGGAAYVSNNVRPRNGGVELDGTVKIVRNNPVVGDGGVELDGHALVTKNTPTIGNGGVELDGTADVAFNRPAVGNGGVELDGTATIVSSYPITGNGGVELDGNAGVTRNNPTVGNGGVELDGTALYFNSGGNTGDGGVELDGEIIPVTNHPVVGNGGVELDGTAIPVTNHPVVGNGGVELDGIGDWTSDGFTPCDRASPMVFGLTFRLSVAAGGEVWFQLPFFTASGTFTCPVDWMGAGAAAQEVFHGSSCATQSFDQLSGPFLSPISVHYTLPEPGYIWVKFTAGPLHGYTCEFTCFFTSD